MAHVRIERLRNGYEVEMCDPEIEKQNRSSKGSYKDPMVGFAFSTLGEVLDFLKKNLDKAMPKNDYSTTFDVAAKGEMDE